jgi:hypothetical protein
MISEEFYFRLQRWENIEAQWEEKYRLFSEKLSSDLPNIVYEFVPRIESRKEEIKDKLENIIQKYITKTWDCFEGAYHLNFNNENTGEILDIREPLSKEESKKELLKKLNDIPKEDHEYYSEIHWDSFNKRKLHEDFLFSVNKKIKEAVAESYAEHIQEFNGDCIRLLNSDIYYVCAYWFVDEVYGLIPRQRK